MAGVRQGRWRAKIDGDFVVFVIGTRLDLRHPLRWFLDVGGMRGMPHMLKDLSEHPEKGLLGYQSFGLVNIQYWRSFEHLEAFSADPGQSHRPAWVRYWERVGRSARSGIWHETYLVRAGEYEAVYANVPPTGLGAGHEVGLVPLAEDSTARGRLKRATGA